MTTTVVLCRCANEFQDRRYGKGRRIANHDAKGNAHCTVCSAKHHATDAPRTKKKTGTGGSGGARSFIAIPPAGGWPGGSNYADNGWRSF